MTLKMGHIAPLRSHLQAQNFYTHSTHVGRTDACPVLALIKLKRYGRKKETFPSETVKTTDTIGLTYPKTTVLF